MTDTYVDFYRPGDHRDLPYLSGRIVAVNETGHHQTMVCFAGTDGLLHSFPIGQFRLVTDARRIEHLRQQLGERL